MKKRYFLFFFLLLFVSFSGFGQLSETSTVVIGEVLYDTPLTETTAKHNGEFLSLYNYGDDSTDISGWRVEVTSLMSAGQITYNYTVPANTILPMYSLAIIAFCAANDTFNIEKFYGSVNPGWHIVLYNNSLTLPNTRSQIKIYNADNIIQDEMVYDGTTAKLPDEQLLRAENGFNPDSLGSQAVSIQRENITVIDEHLTFYRTDYYPHDPKQPVKMFSFTPPDYTVVFNNTSPSYSPSRHNYDSDISLSGTITGTNEYEAPKIESTQIIESGNTKYTAGNEIVLNPGFEVKDGAEFTAIVSNDSLNNLTLMTYNVLHDKFRHSSNIYKYAQVISNAAPDVVALQEIAKKDNFEELKRQTGMDGKMDVTKNRRKFYDENGEVEERADVGHGILWNRSLGNPLKIVSKEIGGSGYVGFMVAEFADVCFVSTHYWVPEKDENDRIRVTKKILGKNIVEDCLDEGKPVYVAGDFNEEPHEAAVQRFVNDGFEILNNTERNDNGQYVERTNPERTLLIDLIIGHNINPNRKIIERGIPEFVKEDEDPDNPSDHKPYYVIIKLK